MDVSVERAACALLLGNTPQSLQLLGLADSSGGQQGSCEESVRDFVLVSDLAAMYCCCRHNRLMTVIAGGSDASSNSILFTP
jgi:hypothetical protein